MTSSVYASSLAFEFVYQSANSALRASYVVLQVVASVSGDAPRSSALGVEVVAKTTSLTNASVVYVEVLGSTPTTPTYIPENASYWSLMPDWGKNGVVERLMWKTDVLTSETGIEQRRRVRIVPRLQVDATFVVHGARRRLLDNLMNGSGANIFYVPRFWERYNTYTSNSAGDVLLVFATAYSPFQPGMRIMVMTDPFTWEVVIVSSVVEDGVVLSTALSKNWPRGAAVFPLRLMRINYGSTNAGKIYADNSYEVTLTFQAVDSWNVFAQTPGVMLNGVGVIPFKPDYMVDMTLEYQRLLAEFDPGMGLTARRDLGLQAFSVQQFNFTMRNRFEASWFRGFLAYLGGKQFPIYVPTFFKDFELAVDMTAGSTVMTVQECGFSNVGGALNANRGLLTIQFRNGAFLTYGITSNTPQEDGTELLVLSAVPSQLPTRASVKRLTFLQKMRQDQDEVEIVHVTDSAGVATCLTTFRSLSGGTRTAPSYDLSYYNGSYTADTLPPALPETDGSLTAPTVVTPPVNSGNDGIENNSEDANANATDAEMDNGTDGSGAGGADGTEDAAGGGASP